MKILINRSDAIGDTILTIPMAKLLKERFPDAHITFLISPKSQDIFLGNPFIDDFIIYHRHLPYYLKLKQVFSIFRKVNPTHYFYVGGGYLPNMIAFLLMVPFRGGLKSKWHTYLFLNKGVRQKRSMVSMHEMEFNLSLLSPLGVEFHYSEKLNYRPELYLSKSESTEASEEFAQTLKEAGMDSNRKYIVIHPGMTGHTLNWSSRNYARFIIKMMNRFPDKFNYIISYTPSDEKYLIGVKEILAASNLLNSKEILFFNGLTVGLRKYMGILSKASLFLGPSTGTTHLASVLGVPVIGIYSPIKAQSSMRWGPVHKNNDQLKILVPDVICGEVLSCAKKECPYYECMGKIEVEDVLKEAIHIMDFKHE